MILVIIGALGRILKGLEKGTGRIRNLRTRWSKIVEIGLNTEKNPGGLRRLAVTQTPVSNHLPVGKTQKGITMIIISVLII